MGPLVHVAIGISSGRLGEKRVHEPSGIGVVADGVEALVRFHQGAAVVTQTDAVVAFSAAVTFTPIG
jgi:hypothetical protein